MPEDVNTTGVTTQVAAPTAEAAPPATAPPSEPAQPTTPTPSTTLTKEEIAQMIAEATSKAVAEAKELGRRELQSQQARNRNQMTEREQRYRQRLLELDPDAAKTLEADDIRTENLQYRQQEQARQVDNLFRQQMTELVTDAGLDPVIIKDALDEASKAGTGEGYWAAQRKVNKAVATALKTKETEAATKALEPERTRNKALEDRVKELEKQLGIEANSVDTSGGGGGGTGKRVYTRAQLSDRAFLNANWADIQLAQQEGRIKD